MRLRNRQYQHSVTIKFWCLLIAVACPALTSCVKTANQLVEAPPPTYQPTPAVVPPALPKLPPKPSEIEVAIRRVFKDAAVLDERQTPNFVTGDFNGDQSQDIAVILKPVSGKIEQLNEEYPPWILNDLRVEKKPGMPRLRIETNDVLLAIIHGVGANDWRDPEATQTFVIKNAVGSELKAHPQKEFKEANTGKKLPQLNGDLIGEALRGASGYLYYTGASYSWYDPRTFRGEPEKRLVHAGAGMKKTK